MTHDTSNPSPLYPDYIAAKTDPTGGYRIAYFEAKGTVYALQNKASCPPNWYNQVRSARLQQNGTPIPSSQNVVVATRLAPDCTRIRSRKIQVRAWNNNDPNLKAPLDAVVEIVRIHYAGVCLRLGLEKTARALAMAPAFHGNEAEYVRWIKVLGRRMPNMADLLKASKEESEERPLNNNEYAPVRYARGRAIIGRGAYAIRSGLSPAASWLVDQFIEGNKDGVARMIHDMPHKLEPLYDRSSDDKRTYVRPDGVYSEGVE